MPSVGGVSAVHLVEDVGVEVKNSTPIPVSISGGGGAMDVNVLNFPAVQAVTATDFDIRNLNPAQDTVAARDIYTGGQTLADQTAAGAALTFSFSDPVQLVYIFFKTTLGTGAGRADPFGGTATASQGIPVDDGVPLAIPVQTSAVSVFATLGATVSVWGFRYA